MDGVREEGLDDELAEVNLAIKVSACSSIVDRMFTYSRLDGNDRTSGNSAAETQVGEQLILVFAVGVAAGVVAVHTEVVAEAMREESSARTSSKDLVGIALEDAELEETVNGNLVGLDMEVVVQHTALEAVGGILVHLENNVVDVARFLGELAVDGKGSGLPVC